MPVLPPTEESTWASSVVGTCTKSTPRSSIAAAKPARSPTTPPPSATSVVLRSGRWSSRSFISLPKAPNSLLLSPAGTVTAGWVRRPRAPVAVGSQQGPRSAGSPSRRSCDTRRRSIPHPVSLRRTADTAWFASFLSRCPSESILSARYSRTVPDALRPAMGPCNPARDGRTVCFSPIGQPVSPVGRKRRLSGSGGFEAPARSVSHRAGALFRLEPQGLRVGTVPRPLFRSCLEDRWNSMCAFSEGH